MISLFRPCYRPVSLSLLWEIARGRYATVLAKRVTRRRKGQLYLFWKPPLQTRVFEAIVRGTCKGMTVDYLFP